MIYKKFTKRLRQRLKAILDAGVPYLLEQEDVNWEMSESPYKIIIKVGSDTIDLIKGDELAIRFAPASFKAFSSKSLYYCKVIKCTGDEVWCDVFYKEEFEYAEDIEELIMLRYGVNYKSGGIKYSFYRGK